MNNKAFVEIGLLKQLQTIHYVYDGSWSLHELLEFILNQTGSAHVRIASFALSEVAVRAFGRLKDENKIRSLECIFDKSCRRTKFDLLNFCQSIAEVRLLENHAKLILIENNNWQVAINTSANFTTNQRYEAGVITTIPSDFKYYNDCFTTLFDNAIPYDL